jgi:putative ABC transport system permease protein
MNVSFVIKAARILLTREWKKFLLPFISLFLTSVIVALTLSITQSSQVYLKSQAKEINGGDVTIESSFPLVGAELESLIGAPYEKGEETRFNATITSGSSTLSTTVRAVDDVFPLYGEPTLRNGVYAYPSASEVYIDGTVASRLELAPGDVLSLNGVEYFVKGIMEKEPDALFSGIRFLPRVLVSKEGLERSSLSTSLLRAEYYVRFKKEIVSSSEKEAFILYGKEKGLDIDIAGVSGGGFREGLIIVSQFLIVAVLISCVLASVNIYASTVYLMSLLRRSFATLLALGLRKRGLVLLLGVIIFSLVIVASALGALSSQILFGFLQEYTKRNLFISLPDASFIFIGIVTLLISSATALASFIPSITSSLRLSPRALLLGIQERKGGKAFGQLLLVTAATLLPLVGVATYLLGDIVKGLVVMFGIILLYAVVSLLYIGGLALLEKRSKLFSFSLRTILAQKRADGFFGIVSFSSLFVALIALSTLALTQVTLENYLSKDLQRTVPPLYLIDVQSSQEKVLVPAFSELTLFPNVGARILKIDGKNIQESLARGDEGVDRELGREYNLTYRTDLLSSEKVVKGEGSIGIPGEVSVDEDFAKRAGVMLNSTVVFSVQGFELSVKVTSLRKTDSRSGLPFFYFVLSPKDISQFPTTYFGYAYVTEERQKSLESFVASSMPNVTLIDTKEVSKLAASIISLLLLFVFVIAVPPLVLALLLVATLVITSFKERKRDGARLLALGATEKFVTQLYFAETISTVILASVLSYVIGIGITVYIALFFLKVSEYAVFDAQIIIGLVSLVFMILVIGIILWKSDKRSLRSILLHEENR